MSQSERFELAEGLTAVIPEDWEYYCESDGSLVVQAIGIRSANCSANLELLNHRDTNPRDFVSTYRFKLMSQLVELGLSFQNYDYKHSDELVAIEEKTNIIVYHAFLSTSPVVHISAVCHDIQNLEDLRLIKDSIRIEQSLKGDSEEDLVGMRLTDSWQLEKEPSEADVKVTN